MSGNPKELRHARKVANEAAAMLEAIESLPRRRGQRVRWRNDVIWTRVGDDQWTPWSEHQPDGMPVGVYPSAHVAQFGFWPVPANVEIRRQS